MASTYSPRRLDAGKRQELFAQLLGNVRSRTAEGKPSCVVFDLDGTLLDNRPRVGAILRELSESWADTFPEAAKRIDSVNTEDIVYDTRHNLELLGVVDEGLITAGIGFWKERFFQDSYLGHDTPYPGCVAYVKELFEAGANIAYLTGRDLPDMALGTFASLRDRGFPIGCVGTNLITKPTFDLPDATFKSQVAESLNRLGEVLGVFDNEPANCNLLLETHPKATVVLMDSQHAPNPPALHSGVHVIHSFE